MMKELKIYFKDQKADQEKINKLTDLADTVFDIRISKASVMIENYGFEFPVVELNSKLYSFEDGMDILKETAVD